MSEMIAKLRNHTSARARKAEPLAGSLPSGSEPGDRDTLSEPHEGSDFSAWLGSGFVEGLPYDAAPSPPSPAAVEGEGDATSTVLTDDTASSQCDSLPYTPLDLLDLPPDISTCLTDHGIWSAQELCALGASEVIQRAGVSRDLLTVLLGKLWAKGLSLRAEIDAAGTNAVPRSSEPGTALTSSGRAVGASSTSDQTDFPNDIVPSADSLATLGLSPRTLFALDDAGVLTVEQLISVSSEKLLTLPGFEQAMITHIENQLASAGLALAPSGVGEGTASVSASCCAPSRGSDGPRIASSQTTALPCRGTMPSADAQHTPLARLDLSVRAYNALIKSGIRTIEALCSCSAEDVLSVRNIGARSLAQIVGNLEALGLALAESPEETNLEPIWTLSDTQAWPNREPEGTSGSEQLLELGRAKGVLTPLTRLNLSPRPQNALITWGIDTVEALCQCTAEEVLAVRNIGDASLHEIERRLHTFGLALAEQRVDAPLAVWAEGQESTRFVSGEDVQGEPRTEREVSPEWSVEATIPLKVLDLPVRVRNSLQRHGVHTVEELCTLTRDDLYRFRNVGVTAIAQVQESLERCGRSLRDQPSDLSSDGVGAPTGESLGQMPLVSLGLADIELQWLRRNKITTLEALLRLSTRELLKLVPASVARSIVHSLDSRGMGLSPEQSPAALGMRLGSRHLASLAPSLIGNEASILYLDLRDVTAQCVLAAGIRTVGELASVSETTLGRLNGMTATNLHEIKRNLRRFALLSGLRQFADEEPIATAYAADARSLSALGLSPGVLSALNLAGFGTIGDVAASRPSLIYELTRGNRAAVEECRKVLGVVQDQQSASNDESLTVVPQTSDVKTTDQVYRDWLDRMSERDQQIVRCYLGMGGECSTLQQIGDAVRLTRERVRQISAKQVRRLQQGQFGLCLNAQAAKLRALLVSLGGVMTVDDIEHRVAEFVPIGDMEPTDAVILIAAASQAIEWLPKQLLLITPELGLPRLTALWDDLDSAVAELPDGTSADDLVYRVSASWFFREEGVEEGTVRAALRSHPQLSVENDRVVRASVRHQLDSTDEIRQALKRIGQPAHYAAIAGVICEMRGGTSELSDHTVHQQLLRRTDRFLRTGPGTFALAEWSIPQESAPFTEPGDGSEPGRLRELKEALRVIGHPAHYKAIAREVARLRAGTPAPTERTIYQYLMSFADAFVRHGGGVYGLPEWERPGQEGAT